MSIALLGTLFTILLAMVMGYAITTIIGIGATFFFTKFFPQMVMKDGSLLVSDDTGKTVWRVAYTGK